MKSHRLFVLSGLLVAGILSSYSQGTYTSLTGFYDYQSNGSAVQHIRVNPSNGLIHAVYMIATDSLSVSSTRRTAYAQGSNNGLTWNNFSSLYIPTRRSGFPSLDLMRSGTCAGTFVIANHSETACVYIECPTIQEICPPSPSPGNSLAYSRIATTADSNIMLVASTTNGNVYATRVFDGQWQQLASYVFDGRYTVAANDNGSVAVVLNKADEGVYLVESTDNGTSWSNAVEVYPPLPPGRIAGVDTFRAWVAFDAIYAGNELVVAINEKIVNRYAPTDSAQIVIWRQSSGFHVAVSKVNTPNVVPRLNRAQMNHLTLGYPALGVSGSTLALVYMAFGLDISPHGWNYGDIFLTISTDIGASWIPPTNLTNTSALDERYPSVGRWNEPGYVNLVWQEDTVPGSGAFFDNAPVSRVRQVFRRWTLLTSIGEHASHSGTFSLNQNFPNPFNPTTRIPFSVSHDVFVSLRVFDVLGREVAALVGGVRGQGQHEVVWDAREVPTGVYLCRLEAGGSILTRKLVLLK